MSELVKCENCGVPLRPHTMKFHLQVCMKSCRFCGKQFAFKSLDAHEASCPNGRATPARPSSGHQASDGPSQDAESQRTQQNFKEYQDRLNAMRKSVYGTTAPVHPLPGDDVAGGALPYSNSAAASGGQSRSAHSSVDRGESESRPRQAQNVYPTPAPHSMAADSTDQYVTKAAFDKLVHEFQEQKLELRRLRQFVEDVKKLSIAHNQTQDDIFTLGRHVDALRDEVEAAVQQSSQQPDRNDNMGGNVGSADEMIHLAAGLENQGRDLADVVAAVNNLTEDMQKLKKEGFQQKDRENFAVVRRDVKYMGRDVDTLKEELTHLRRQLETDRRYVEENLTQKVLAGIVNTPSSHVAATPRSVSATQEQSSSSAHAPPVHVVGVTRRQPLAPSLERKDPDPQKSDTEDLVTRAVSGARRSVSERSTSWSSVDAPVSRVSLRDSKRK